MVIRHQPVGHPESSTYRVFDVKRGTAEERAWMAWFKFHNVPVVQVPYKGWAIRDVARRRISVLVFDWNPDDEPLSKTNTRAYVDRDNDGNRISAARMGVLTIQLEAVPLLFPDPPPEEDAEHGRAEELRANFVAQRPGGSTPDRN